MTLRRYGEMKRREFLKTTAMATAVIAGSPLRVESNTGKTMVRQYRELGTTGIKISDISFGTGKLASPSMILRAVDRGINYFDTAPDYGTAEKLMGEAMGKIQRDKIIIASKFCNPVTYPGHLPLGSKKKDYVKAFEGSLKRLKTDYLDVGFVHAIGEMSKKKDNEVKRLFDEEMLAAVDDLKKSGKLRFLAVSSHGPDNMEDLLMTAVKSGTYDLIMMAFNFMKFPRAPEVMREADKRGVGVIAMKTLAGAKDMELDTGTEAFEPAAFKWVLKHPEVDGLVITIKTIDDLDLYLRASGERFTAADRQMLDRYARIHGKAYCRTGCGACQAACPAGVSVATTLRYQMYFRDYGMEKRAMESYAAVRENAEICLSCEKPSCVDACVYGLPVHDMLCEAHGLLSFNV
jgi:aryl-alcohol dehydrogenase-like predicted oxidoreductase